MFACALEEILGKQTFGYIFGTSMSCVCSCCGKVVQGDFQNLWHMSNSYIASLQYEASDVLGELLVLQTNFDRACMKKRASQHGFSCEPSNCGLV